MRKPRHGLGSGRQDLLLENLQGSSKIFFLRFYGMHFRSVVQIIVQTLDFLQSSFIRPLDGIEFRRSRQSDEGRFGGKDAQISPLRQGDQERQIFRSKSIHNQKCGILLSRVLLDQCIPRGDPRQVDLYLFSSLTELLSHQIFDL